MVDSLYIFIHLQSVFTSIWQGRMSDIKLLASVVDIFQNNSFTDKARSCQRYCQQGAFDGVILLWEHQTQLLYSDCTTQYLKLG